MAGTKQGTAMLWLHRAILPRDQQPIFGKAAQMQLPAIARVDFLEYLDFQFEATGKPADEDALRPYREPIPRTFSVLRRSNRLASPRCVSPSST